MNPARRLNAESAAAIDRAALADALTQRGLDVEALRASHPDLFADPVVFVTVAEQQAMADLIAAIEAVVALPAYQEAVLAWAPEIARHDPGHPGVFLGYDFHLTEDGPRLIEINSNAGGGFLNACLNFRKTGAILEDFLKMFREEVRRAGYAPDEAHPLRLALVDTNPKEQFLFPEFELVCRSFAESGWQAVIADPSELFQENGRLCHATGPVDIIYNRLTDFSLSDPAHAALREVWRNGGVVLTPHPRAHALYADKRNLTLLSDPDWLKRAGVPEGTRTVLLTGIPCTIRVTPKSADDFRKARKTLFFKPASGFGSRAAYRGQGLTRRVFEEILAGN